MQIHGLFLKITLLKKMIQFIRLKKWGMPCKIMINLKDVKRVELYYGTKQKSKIRLWLESNKIFGRLFKEQGD